MDIRHLPHNSHLDSIATFRQSDPHLRRLAVQPLQHISSLIEQLPESPGIYTLTGGRQVGKTTLLKQWMDFKLTEGAAPDTIFFFTGELIDDHHSLVKQITALLDEKPNTKFLLLDEVTYIRNWDKGIKYLADAGFLADIVLLITGSDTVIIKEARTRFPGRRGVADQVDFHLYPLSFQEFIRLKNTLTSEEISSILDGKEATDKVVGLLFAEFDNYLLHGGFLTAINDMAAHGRILPATFHTYSDWIRGDIIKRGKQEHYLREITKAIIKRLGSQITWNNLLADMVVEHAATVADYIELLVSMDAVFIQWALREDKLTAAPKKARKVIFTDPFILHALNAWLRPCGDPFKEQALLLRDDPKQYRAIVEACAVSLCRRRFPTFYIKAKGEVDIAYIDNGCFWPVEIKWTARPRPEKLKQARKYANSKIWTREKKCGKIFSMPTEPLPLALFKLG
jgi:predicted AAA+ superfamily ATPase